MSFRIVSKFIQLTCRRNMYVKNTISSCRFQELHQIRNIASEMVAMSGTMQDVKNAIIKKLGINAGYSPLKESREHLLQYEPKNINDLPPRNMQDSFTSALIPLSKDLILQDKYATFMGTIRLGRLMEDMDLFAVWVIHKHLYLPNHPADVPLPYTFVTILVDKIDFTDFVPKQGSDIRISGHVSWVGKSSVEVVVWLEQNVNNAWQKLTRALFLMAARNASNTKAAFINPLIANSVDEEKILRDGELRKKRRLAQQGESLMKSEPNDFEQHLIHKLFMKTLNTNDYSLSKRILPPGCIWMSDSNMETIIFSHPEDRNAHNTIFGGFLMRNALELSWITAFNYSNHRPKLERISDISFHRPVPISSFIKMRAKVIYTEINYMQILVIAEVSSDNRAGDNAKTSNVFYYTYSVNEPVSVVMPKSYAQAMLYIDGRRRFKYAMGININNDQVQ